MTDLELRVGRLRRGGAEVLAPWCGRLPAGCVCGVAGRNGAGKSSLLLGLAGALRPRSGRGSAWWVDPVRDAGPGAPARAEVSAAVGPAPGTGVGAGRTVEGVPVTVALVDQVPVFPGPLDLAGLCALHGLDAAVLVDRLPGLHLDELLGVPARALSGGQTQAVAVALALAAEADLTLLDEPLAALDARRRRGLLDLLRAGPHSPARRGVVLLSSQSATDLHAACDHLLLLADGRVVHHGATAVLLGAASPGPAALEARLAALLGGPLDPPDARRSGGARGRAGAGRGPVHAGPQLAAAAGPPPRPCDVSFGGGPR